MKIVIVLISIALLALVGIAIGVWFIPFTMWGVSAAGVVIRVVMPMIAQILLKGFLSLVSIGLIILTILGLCEIRYF